MACGYAVVPVRDRKAGPPGPALFSANGWASSWPASSMGTCTVDTVRGLPARRPGTPHSVELPVTRVR
ncbi:hypothetical protein AB0L75_28100 [Streptomyces sp. NPDC052101]|uniref:hypothetical protein n=1 Tax=Streptomyces sp. NPDC052101 TaxID=3155763 RepID=UPI00342893BE